MPSSSLPPPRANFWLPPYGYAQALAVVVGLWATGSLLQAVAGPPPSLLWPVSGAALALLCGLLIAAHRLLRGTAVHGWLGGIPFALCVIGGLTVLAAIGGVVPQGPDAKLPGLFTAWGWHQMFASWPFLLLMLLLLLCLGLTILKNASLRGVHKAAMTLSHVGLWLALACGVLGAGDLTRRDIIVPEGQASRMGYDTRGRAFAMPFEVYLKAFELDEYPPTALWVDAARGEPLARDMRRSSMPLTPGVTSQRIHRGARYTARIQKTLAHARWVRDQHTGLLTFVASRQASDAPAALVTLTRQGLPARPANTPTDTRTGWITRGGATSLPQALSLGDAALAMAEANPKRFASRILARDINGGVQALTVTVNQPVSLAGWRVYQKSYEQPLGMGRAISVLEAIRDPWLPGVYAGLVLMALGAFLALLFGAVSRKTGGSPVVSAPSAGPNDEGHHPC